MEPVDENEAIQQLEAEGKLTLHRVVSEVNSPMWQALIKMVADMNGKQPGKVIRLVADAEIPFQVRNGRVHHEGMRVGFPDIDPQLVVSTRGSIGVDETLDVFVELPRNKSTSLTRGLVKVTGTLKLNPSDPENFLYTIEKAKVSEAD